MIDQRERKGKQAGIMQLIWDRACKFDRRFEWIEAIYWIIALVILNENDSEDNSKSI